MCEDKQRRCDQKAPGFFQSETDERPEDTASTFTHNTAAGANSISDTFPGAAVTRGGVRGIWMLNTLYGRNKKLREINSEWKERRSSACGLEKEPSPANNTTVSSVDNVQKVYFILFSYSLHSSRHTSSLLLVYELAVVMARNNPAGTTAVTCYQAEIEL